MTVSAPFQSHAGLIAALQDGPSADIWYDADDFDDSNADERIDITKRALEDAAEKLMGLDVLRERLQAALAGGEITGTLAEELAGLLDAVAPKNAQEDLAYNQVDSDDNVEPNSPSN